MEYFSRRLSASPSRSLYMSSAIDEDEDSCSVKGLKPMRSCSSIRAGKIAMRELFSSRAPLSGLSQDRREGAPRWKFAQCVRSFEEPVTSRLPVPGMRTHKAYPRSAQDCFFLLSKVCTAIFRNGCIIFVPCYLSTGHLSIHCFE
jgi:hypothetical protein